MSPEKFRQWIVILFAISIVTVWVGVGLNAYRWNRLTTGWRKVSTMKEMPRMQRSTMPLHGRPVEKTKESAESAQQKAK